MTLSDLVATLSAEQAWHAGIVHGDARRSGQRYYVTTLHNHVALVCLECLQVSFNPNDIAQKYCGACHCFLGDTVSTREP